MSLLDFFTGRSPGKAMEIPIFPLNTVLLPGSILALKVFEQRYIDMTKNCLKENSPFGVCLIVEGGEVGSPALPERVGCLASIIDWDMQQLGIFNLKTLGARRFRIESHEVGRGGLVSARVRLLPDEPATPLSEEHHQCATVLRMIIDKLGNEYFQEPYRFDDAVWVSYRLTETLPIKIAAKQKLLELDSSAARLRVLHKFLVTQGLGN